MSVPEGVIRDYARWRRRLREAIDARDERAELNAREMLQSIEAAAENPALPITARAGGYAETVAEGLGMEPGTLPRVGRGFVDVREGTRQTLGAESPQQAARNIEEEGIYERGVEAAYGPDFLDVARMGGQAAATAPIGALMSAAAPLAPAGGALSTALGRAGIGAATGAGSGALIYAPTPEERATNIGAGAAAGGVLAPAIPAITRAGSAAGQAVRRGGRAALNRLVPAARRMAGSTLQRAAERAGVSLERLGSDALATLQDDVTRALNAGTLDEAALQRRLRAAQFGFVDDAAPTTGQLTRDPAQFSDEWNAARAEGGEELAQRFQSQRNRAEAAIGELRDEIGGPGARSVTPEQAGEALETGIRGRARELQRGVSQAYEAAEAVRPDVAVPLDRMREGINALRETTDLSLLPPEASRRVQGFFETGTATPRQLVNLRELLRRSRGSDPAVNRTIGEITDLVDDTLDTLPEFAEEYGTARAAARARGQAIGPRGTRTRRIVDAPEPDALDAVSTARILRSGNPREIRRIRDLLQETNPEAWRQGQASVINEIARRARSDSGANFSEAGYRNALEAIGPDRLRAVFGNETAQRLQDLGDTFTDLMLPPSGHRIQTSNNYGAFLTLLRRTLGDTVTGFVEGAGQRAQTGGTVRSALQGGMGAASPQANRLLSAPARYAGPAGGVIGAELAGPSRDERRNRLATQ